VFATVHDGPRAQHLNELVTVAGEGLLQVFSRCDKELQGAPRDRLRRHLKEHIVENSAFWGSHLGRSLAQVRAESGLRREIRRALGDGRAPLSRDPYAEARDLVQGRADLRWALESPPSTRTAWYEKVWLAATRLPVALLLAVLMPGIRWLETREARAARAETSEDPVAERLEERMHKNAMRADEDAYVQNQLTTVSEVKPGILRLLALRAVLRVVDAVGRIRFDQGALAGSRTIHFARWFLVRQGGRHRLVFLSNYDRSWENYLGEFVDEASVGLTGIWSNTEGFPETRWLFGAGARRELKFKRWVRRQQVRTQVWYSAYPDDSVANVQNNSEIRRGLQGLRGLEEQRAWLRRV
jgi:hypothetical protein